MFYFFFRLGRLLTTWESAVSFAPTHSFRSKQASIDVLIVETSPMVFALMLGTQEQMSYSCQWATIICARRVLGLFIDLMWYLPWDRKVLVVLNRAVLVAVIAVH